MEYVPAEAASMEACILEVQCNQLLVRDLSNDQEVLVYTNRACCFCPGERVIIEYDGTMTLSLPPQISADRIYHGSQCC